MAYSPYLNGTVEDFNWTILRKLTSSFNNHIRTGKSWNIVSFHKRYITEYNELTKHSTTRFVPDYLFKYATT